MDKLNVKKMGLSAGILSALCMLALGISGNLGIYMGAVGMMMAMHEFFNLSFSGIVSGMIEGFIGGTLMGVGIAYFYNIIKVKKK